MELYQAKLVVLHAAYRIDNKLDLRSEVSMAKHFSTIAASTDTGSTRSATGDLPL